MKSTRLLIVERFPLTVRGLRDLLRAQGGRWEICAAASCGREALAQAEKFRPQAVILDDQIEHGSVLAVAAQLKRRLRRVAILVHIASSAPPWVHQLCQSTVAGCLLKSEAPESLLRGLETICGHDQFRSRGTLELSARHQAMHRRGTGQPLSGRELEVARLLASGLSTKEAAAALGLSPHTIETHRGRIYGKLGLSSVVALAHWAIECGLVGNGQPWGQG
jgi:DNA-binding NarL/FixJ family response regulator